MVITVRCLSCEAVYETEATADAVREIGRCMRCGRRTLRVVDEPDEEGEDQAEA
jgi:rRNA maturation endonuclease Nob1